MASFVKYSVIGFLLLFFLVFDVSVALSDGPVRSDPQEMESPVTIDFSLKAGCRVDQFDWNIAGNNAGTDPNILSELTWEDLEIYQVQLESRLAAGNRQRDGYLYHLRGMLGWGKITDGSNQDSDYAGDNRTLEFSRSNNAADDGSVFDFSVGGGLEFSGQNERWTLIPVAGFSYHEQNLQITDGYQTVSDRIIADDFFGPGQITMPPLGPFEGLDSRYDSEWYGPWLGLELIFQPVDRWQLSGIFEHHWVDYEGEANWNLRQNLAHPVSFSHWADGTGLVFGLELSGKLSKSWSCDLAATYQDWQTDAGTDITYLANGTTAGTRVNEVNWESFSVMAGLTRRF